MRKLLIILFVISVALLLIISNTLAVMVFTLLKFFVDAWPSSSVTAVKIVLSKEIICDCNMVRGINSENNANACWR